MPEGDTIFRAATALRKALEGARVTQFRSAKLGRGPVGERIEEVTARGPRCQRTCAAEEKDERDGRKASCRHWPGDRARRRLAWLAPGSLRWMGRLPGDIRGEHFAFPIVTCLVISVVLTIVLNVLARLLR